MRCLRSAMTYRPSLVLAALGLLVAVPPARALSLFDSATEWTQLANNAELVSILKSSGQQVDNQLTQITQLAEQIQNQLKIYQNLLQNTAQLPDQMWSDAERDLSTLRATVEEGQSIAFSLANADEVLSQRFRSYADFQAATPQGEDLATAYGTWSSTNRDTIVSTVRAAALTSQQFNSETDALRSLEAQSQSADGQLKALQVGHEIAVEQVAQMQKLRGLLSQQTTMIATWLQSVQSANDLTQSRLEKFFNADVGDIPEGQKMEPRW